MNQELDSILEQSLSQIASGQARVESCLLAYPALGYIAEPEIPETVLEAYRRLCG